MGVPNAGGVGKNGQLSTNDSLYLEKVQGRCMVSIKVE